jgi:molybdenum cofactor cytidylyltransferase
VEQVRDALAAVVLAAGLSRRMGTNKLLLPLPDGPLCARALALAARFPVRVLVANAPALCAMGERQGFFVVPNPSAAQGLGTSVAAGTRALPPAVRGCLYLNADQPHLSEALIDRLVEVFAQTDRIVVPRTADGPKNPCLFPRRYFPALGQLSGETGGRAIWQRHADDVSFVPVAETGLFTDIDERAHYERLLHKE